MKHKVQAVESLDKLQNHYGRVMRTAIGTQKDSRENYSKLLVMRKKLMETQTELRKQRDATTSLQARNQQLVAQNGTVMARVAVLEALIASQPSRAHVELSATQRVYQEGVVLRQVGLY